MEKVQPVSTRTPNALVLLHKVNSRIGEAFQTAISNLQKGAERAKQRAQKATDRVVSTQKSAAGMHMIKFASGLAQAGVPFFGKENNGRSVFDLARNACSENQSTITNALYMSGTAASDTLSQGISAGLPKDQAAQQAAESAKRKASETEQVIEQQARGQRDSESRQQQMAASMYGNINQ